MQFKKVDFILVILFEIKFAKFTSTKFLQFRNISDIDSKALLIVMLIVIFFSFSDEL